ncbi:DeoR/GlpR family DNA-binding transcription regulator [Nocardioides sp.]|uniref:DeoR/GlpR family DNA-binding transcription regulator n=1 Tax=Nocardioides sp. TaxID=35761 RepID=UPI002608E508|nr:DeoR/GlpR family DNA-binding transcription regulator [Nocardioides sp.]MDI6909042.1 DeoR/GlpR family DNA-binding transcription regulator [Nocardioides sp.]
MTESPAAERGRTVRGRKADVRQTQIADLVMTRGSCSPQELATEFGVSLMTVHRDLEVLERRGIVRRFHGGVTAQASGVFEAQLSHRLQAKVDEKTAIARAALDLVDPGMSLLLDDSTTVRQMIPGLQDKAPLHVATMFLEGLRMLSQIATRAELTIIGLGGVYNASHDCFVGLQCIEQIRSIRADAVFLSTSAVSSGDAFHQEERIVELKRQMLDVATFRCLLVDSSKLGRVALHRVVPLDAFDLIITDAGANPAVLQAWDTAGIAYQIAT